MTKNITIFRQVAVMIALTGLLNACGTAPAEPQKPISINKNPQIGEPKAPEPASAADAAPGENGAVAKVDTKALIDKGKTLIAGSDCFACHQEKDKLVGPSYADVAKKYKETDIPLLVKKIIEGGSGTWGDIPMAPHAGLMKADAEAMVHYILSIK